MATILKYSAFFIQICFIYTASSAFTPFSDILEDSKLCEEKCTKSFAPHTYPNGSDNTACMRGCRLYTVTNFITADEPQHTNTIDDNGLSPAKLLCYNSCVDAYNETSSSTTACRAGCDAQEILSLKREAEKIEPEGGIHLLKPVMQIREVVSKVVGMMRIIQSTITTYFLRDDNKMVAMEGPVEVVVQMIPPNELQKEAMKEVESSPFGTKDEDESIPEMIMSSGTASIECLSKRVGVPPYLLIISLVSFIIFLTYIIFVICSSSKKKQKKMKSAFPIPTHALPVKLVRPEDLTKLSLMDEEETHAPALQTKVKLPDNTNV